MAEGDFESGGAIQSQQQQQTTTAQAEQAALRQQEAAQDQAVAAQAAPPPEYLKKYTQGAAASQYESVPTGQAAPWESTMLRPNSTQTVANPNYDPNWFATHGPTIYLGYLYVPSSTGAINPGTTYQVAASNQQYALNAYGRTIGNIFYDPSTVQAPQASQAPTEAQDPLYLTWVGGRIPSLSAVQTPGSVLYEGPRNFTGAGAGSLASVLGYGAGYSGDSSASGGSTSPGGETATSQNDRFFGRGEYAPKVVPGVATDAQSMAGTPVPGAPGVYFSGDIGQAPVVTTNTRLDAGGSIPTPYSSNAATAVPNRSFSDNVIAAGVGVGATLYTGSEVLKTYGEAWASGVSGVTQSVQTGVVGASPDFAKGYVGFMSDITKGATNTVIGGIPATAAALPFAGAWSLTNPTGVPEKAVEIGTEMYTTEKEKLFTRPGEFIGDVAGMYIGGKVVAPVVDPVVGGVIKGAKAVSPIGVDIVRIPTATGEGSNIVATVSTRNPLSVNPPTPRAFAMAGSEIEGLQYGRGSPVPAAIDQGITVQAPALFNVRDASITATDAQVRFLDPFFRQVSKGTAEEPIVNAMFDLKQALPRSEAAIDYAKVQAQPIGSAKQVGISPETKAAVFESLANTAPETRYVGSQALAETIGEKYVRPVVESDIDLSMPAKTFNPSFQALKEVYAQETTSTVTGGQSARGYSFKTSALEGEHTLGVVGETKDVRTYNARTAEGSIVKTQTPEYAIESKASRTLGPDIGIGGKSQAPSRLAYTPEEGTSFSLGGKKPASDLADIYAASRGIARSAYQEKYYDLGKTYEGISENVKAYAKTTGTAEKIATIPEDALAGVQKAPIRPGQILGVNLDIFPAAEAVEYPLYKAPKTPTVPTLAATPEAYPTAKAGTDTTTTKTTGNVKEEKYPESKLPKEDVTSIGGTYPEATLRTSRSMSATRTYPEYTPTEATTERISTYPESSKTSGGHYATAAPALSSSYAVAAPAAAYPTGAASVAMYPGVAVPYGGGYALAGAPHAASYPVGYPRGGETTYPTSPAVAPTQPYPTGYPSNVSGRTTRIFVPEKVVAVPFQDSVEEKPKRKVSKGKTFGEVFSFDVDKNFRTPERLLKKSSPNRFKESFAMDTKSTFNKATFGKLNSPFESIKPLKNKRSK